MTSTHDVTGRQLPLVTAPVEELGDDWLHTCLDLLWQPRKAGKNMGMLAAVANCGKSQKWCSRGRLALGFKIQAGSHVASFWDHAAWAEKNHGLLFFF